MPRWRRRDCRCGARGLPDAERALLERRWLDLTRETLPGLALARRWAIRQDHCFQRVLLDHAVGGCWYDRIAGRPAYRHIAVDALARAVVLGEAIVAGQADLAALNARSLEWRRRSTSAKQMGRRVR